MRKKWLAILAVIALLLFLSNNLQLDRLHPRAAALMNKIEEKWRGIKTPQLSGLEAHAVLVMDQDSGKVLYAYNDKKKMYPASTTKILTALILLEKGDPDELVTIGGEASLRTLGESSSGLQEGDRLSVQDLVAAMMLPSGNDAARTAAIYIAEKEMGHKLETEKALAYFAEMMNQRAKELGAKNSHFVNPHGLHHPDHYTTAQDMAAIAMAAMNNELFQTIVSAPVYDNHGRERTLSAYHNRNKLIQPDNEWYFKGANGVKTGYTEMAGYCLVGSAVRNDKALITVVLHSTELGVWSDSIKLLDFGFHS
ncbi:D-alanyl-D-alanine carboxypeptidase family protein [Paenibacillus lentus]|uniref:D-alanyl-D-alanine carboxypeptidase family protein n=1 Tax=Paenibacillus lentus TaxID=1338368 RepID=UPI0013DE6AD2|nr:D-alanyl-D-alanine carboxypeptidase family protein [Paenibacillus lentus]